jgi:hypothetical protein
MNPIASLPFFAADVLPTRWGELESALGVRVERVSYFGHGSIIAPLEDDETLASPHVAYVSVEYAWDMHHEMPVATLDEVRARRLVSYAVVFKHGREACEARLVERFGSPAVVRRATNAHGVIEYRSYGPLFVTTGPERFTVEWFAETPDWALTCDPGAREAFLTAALARVSRAKTADDVVRALASPPADAGVVVKTFADTAWLEFRPAMPAADVVRHLRVERAIGATTDVHMSNWELTSVTGRGAHGLTTSTPRLGQWSVHAGFTRPPSGERHEPTGPFARRELGEGDLVRTLQIRASRGP